MEIRLDFVKKPWFLMLIGIGVFAPIYLVSGLNGYDSYAFLNQVCIPGYWHSPLNSLPSFPFVHFVQEFVFSLIPCNLFLIKTLLLFLFLSSLMITRMMAGYVLGEEGWLAPYFLFMVPANFLFFFWKFENDTLGFPLALLGIMLLAWAFYREKDDLVVGGMKIAPKGWKKQVLCVLGTGFMLVAALLWGGSGVALVGASLLSPLIFLLSLPALWVSGKALFLGIGENPLILENHLLVGLASMTILNIGFLSPILPPLTLFVGVATFVSGKFSILAAPLLAVSTLRVIHNIDWGRYVSVQVVIAVLFMVSVLFGFYSSFWVLDNLHPDSREFEAVQYAVGLHNSNGKPLISDFWYGYMLDSLGYVSGNYGGYDPHYLDNVKGNIVLTSKSLKCRKKWEDQNIYVYDC